MADPAISGRPISANIGHKPGAQFINIVVRHVVRHVIKLS